MGTIRLKNGIILEIRPALFSDSSVIEKNIAQVCSERIYLHTQYFIHTDEWESLLVRSVDLEKRQVLLVAAIEQHIIGHVRLFPLWFGEKGRHVANVGIVITKPWREIGIGTALTACILKWAIKLEYMKATVEVFSINLRAINLFRKFGFVEEGRRFNQIKLADWYCDEVLMGLDLSKISSIPQNEGGLHVSEAS